MKFILFFIVFLSLSPVSFAKEATAVFGSLELFGTTKDGAYKLRFGEELDSVPLCTPNQGGFYGIYLNLPDEEVHTFKVIATIPDEALVAGSNVSSVANSSEGKMVAFDEIKVQKSYIHNLFFDDGDPAGQYKLEIMIDDELIKTIVYHAHMPCGH